MSYVDVREPTTGKLLFRYDPTRAIIEIQQRNVKTVVDLQQYQEQPMKCQSVFVAQEKPATPST